MKVSIVRAGGLAGLVTRTSLESQALPGERADELPTKVSRA